MTRLLFRANLSHERLTGYLAELSERQWISEQVDGRQRSWHLTEEGKKVLLELERMGRFMRDFGLGF